MARLAAVALLLLAAWALTVMPARAQEATFAVEGRVENGTSGIAAAQVEVVLHTVRGAARTDEPTLTDDQGAFRFDDVPLDPAAAYGVSVVYQGALYGMDLDTSAGPPGPVTLTVYESTHDDGAVRAVLASVLFASVDREEQTVAALEIVRIVNESNHTYVPGPEPMNLLRFGLPPDAHSLDVDTTLPEADYAQVDRGFALLAGVPPGEHEVLYSYSFPYSGGGAEFTKSLLYGAEHLRVLAPEGELSLSSGELGEVGSVVLGGRPYHLIEARDLPRGDRVTVRLEDLPELSGPESVRQWFESVPPEASALGILGVVIVCAFGVVVWRRRRAARSEPDDGAESDGEMGAFAEIVTLRQMLAGLDDDLVSGSLSESDHRRRRRILETRLEELE